VQGFGWVRRQPRVWPPRGTLGTYAEVVTSQYPTHGRGRSGGCSAARSYWTTLVGLYAWSIRICLLIRLDKSVPLRSFARSACVLVGYSAEAMKTTHKTVAPARGVVRVGVRLRYVGHNRRCVAVTQ
jgi:hypothetical protein